MIFLQYANAEVAQRLHLDQKSFPSSLAIMIKDDDDEE